MYKGLLLAMLMSSVAFADPNVAPSFTVLTPKAHDIVVGGSTVDITWSSDGDEAENVTIYYRTDTLRFAFKLIALSTPNDGKFEWTVPNEEPTPSADVYIMGKDEEDQIGWDLSDTFVIILGDDPPDPVNPVVVPEQIKFITPLSKYREGVEDSFYTRPAFPSVVRFGILNNSPGNLSVESITSSNPSVTFGDFLFAFLRPGETILVDATYAPEKAGERFGEEDWIAVLTSKGGFQIPLVGKSTFDADVSYDAEVTNPDVALLIRHYRQTSEHEDYDPTADFNGDGRIDTNDLAVLLREWRKTLLTTD